MSVSWSLAVEAQFYLLWPFLCWRMEMPRLQRALVALLFLAPALRLVAAAFGANDMQLYVLTPARLDAFAAGALVATARRGWAPPPLLRRLTSGAAAPRLVVALVVAMLLSQMAALALPGLSPFLSAFDYSALALLYAAAVAACLAPTRRVTRRIAAWLERPVMRRLGRYSYGIFLTNLAVAEGLRLAGLGLEWALGDVVGQLVFYPVATVACVAVGAFVYHAIEAPFLTLRRYVPRGMPTRNVERDGAPGSGSRPVSQVKDSLFLS
jgi:peptidoglycan/LPS O-acetylase OafA/YrhL